MDGVSPVPQVDIDTSGDSLPSIVDNKMSSGAVQAPPSSGPMEAFAAVKSPPKATTPAARSSSSRSRRRGRGSSKRIDRSKSRSSTLSRRSTASTAFGPQLLSQLSLEGDALQQRIQLTEADLQSVTDDIKRMAAKISMQRRTVAQLRSSASTGRSAQRKMMLSEKRAEKVRAQLNRAKAANDGLRSEINECRRHRVSYQGILRKLELQFEARQEEMERLVEESTQANRALDRTATAIQRVEQAALREKQEFKSKWKKLGDTIAQEIASEAAISNPRIQTKRSPSRGGSPKKPGSPTKKTRRTTLQNASKRREALRVFGGDLRHADADTQELVNNLQLLRSKNQRQPWTVARVRNAQAISEKKVAEYQAAFEKIHTLTGAKTMDELVTTFIAAEERNYSLFRYASQINAELEQHNQSIAELDAEIEKFRGLGMETDDKRRRVLESLITRLEHTEAKIQEHEIENSAAQHHLMSIVGAVKELFAELGCDVADGADLLRDTGVTPSTLMPHLGLVEQRTHEVLQAYAAVMPRKGRTAAAVAMGKGPPVPTGTVRLVVPPPRLDDFDDDQSGIDNRPLTRTELHSLMYNSSAFAAIKQAIASASR